MTTIKFRKTVVDEINQFAYAGRYSDLKTFYNFSNKEKAIVFSTMIFLEVIPKISSTKHGVLEFEENCLKIYKVVQKQAPNDDIRPIFEKSRKKVTEKTLKITIVPLDFDSKSNELKLNIIYEDEKYLVEEWLVKMLQHSAMMNRKTSDNLSFLFAGLNFLKMARIPADSVKRLPTLYNTAIRIFPVFKRMSLEERIKVLNMAKLGNSDKFTIANQVFKVLWEQDIVREYVEFEISRKTAQGEDGFWRIVETIENETLWTEVSRKIDIYAIKNGTTRVFTQVLDPGDDINQIRQKFRQNGWGIDSEVLRFITYKKPTIRDGNIQKGINRQELIKPFIDAVSKYEQE